jgi:hypothetical protein
LTITAGAVILVAELAQVAKPVDPVGKLCGFQK